MNRFFFSALLVLMIAWLGFPNPAQTDPYAPKRIQIAGYLDTNLTFASGKNLTLWAYSPDLGDQGRMELYFEGVPTGVTMPRVDSEGVFLLSLPVGRRAPPGLFLLELLGTTSTIQTTGLWPYLNVATAPPTPTPTLSPTPVGTLPGVTMVPVSTGSFTMGSPETEPCRDSDETEHQVTLIRSFLMQNTEVTQGQWTAIFGSNPSYFPSCGSECPVVEVTWYDVMIFCNRLSQWEGYRPAYYSDSAYNAVFDGVPPVTSGSVYWDLSANGYRLPTEAEWEYAARAGTTGPFAFPCSDYSSNCNSPSCINAFGWDGYNSGVSTHHGGDLQGNAWNLYDMHGNVWEWCWDWYGDYPSGSVTNPIGNSSGSYRVRRGGGFDSVASNCRSAYRGRFSPEYGYFFIGFRLARTP